MATLTITVPDGQVARVRTAIGSALNLVDGNGDPRDATADEVRQYLVDTLKAQVRAEEEDAAADAARSAVTDVDAVI